ncbi:unnamed protein product [Urochloa humidicola]
MASRKLVALFFAFAVAAAATARPSEARIQDQLLHPSTFHNHNTPPPPSSPGGAVVPPHPSTAGGAAPARSSPPPAPAPPLTECMTPLIGMLQCMDYLTNLTVLTPPPACCDGLKAVIRDAPICLCHGMTGDMNSLMPKPIDPVRMITVPLLCGAVLPIQTILSCNTQQVPPIFPPMPAPAPADAPASP